MADGLAAGRIEIPDIDGDQNDAGKDNNKEEAQLVAFKYLLNLAAQQQKVQGEVYRKQQHEDGDDDLDGGTAVGRNGEIAGGEAAGTGSSEGVDDAVVPGHAGNAQDNDLDGGEGAVDPVEDLGGLTALGYQLADHRAGALRLHQVEGAGAQTGQQSDGEDEYTHTAQPVDEGAPEQDAPGQGLYRRQNGGTGGGEAGDCLKETVDVGVEVAAEEEGERAEGAHQQPDQSHREEALPGEEVVVAGHEGEQKADDHHQRNGVEEGGGVLLVDQAHQQGDQHGHGLHHQGLACDLEYQSEVHCAAPRSSRESS